MIPAPQHTQGADRDEALPSHVLRATAEQRDEEGAEGLGRVEEPEDGRRGVEDVEDEGRVQRHRETEDHRVEVDPEGALQDLLAPEEPKPIDDRGPSDREPLGGRRGRMHPGQRDDHGEVAHGVEHVGVLDPERCDQHAGEHGARERRRLVVHDLEGERGRVEIPGQQTGRPGPQRRRVQGVRGGPQEREREEDPHARLGQEGVHRERDRERRRERVGDHQHPAPLHRVGDGTAHDRQHDERDRLEQGEQTDHRRRPGDRVDVERHGDERDLGSELGDRLADEQPPEVGGDLERGEVDPMPPEPGHQARMPGLRRHRRWELVLGTGREAVVVGHGAGR